LEAADRERYGRFRLEKEDNMNNYFRWSPSQMRIWDGLYLKMNRSIFEGRVTQIKEKAASLQLNAAYIGI
jgi:hypothetical protein